MFIRIYSPQNLQIRFRVKKKKQKKELTKKKKKLTNSKKLKNSQNYLYLF